MAARSPKPADPEIPHTASAEQHIPVQAPTSDFGLRTSDSGLRIPERPGTAAKEGTQPMPYRFEREARTPYSEVFIIENEEGEDLGRVDLHFTPSVTYATLCVGETLDEEGIQDLIAQIDERLVMTTDPYREDFVVTVWRGSPAGVYSDSDADDDEDEDTFRLN
jgi:hypothetical protein